MDTAEIDAPIGGVTVYPDRARVTRRGGTRLAAGQHRVRVAPLPLGLRRDSVRVGGRGAATVLGVDVTTWRQARSTDAQVVGLEQRRRELADELAEIDDTDGIEAQRGEFLTRLAERAGGTYARALAAGDAAPSDVTTFTDSVAAQLADSRTRRRGLARRRTELGEELAAVGRDLDAAHGKQQPDRLAVEVIVAVEADDADVELELTYLVEGARWQPSYDLRLVDDTMTVTWFGMVSQSTGEDWPECELHLSTARPGATTGVPELSPWYLDRFRPPSPRATPDMVAGMPAFGAAPAGIPARAAPPAPQMIRESVAEVEQGRSAATYRPARPVAVPADGSAHRATIAVLELPARLDHVTAPVRAAEAHLRATVRNTSEHTLLPGQAAVFHDADFVASTRLPMWAPGEETELALGVDDRLRVERKLHRRAETKATLGSTRRREVEYRITVGNHTPRPATVEVRDQLPVSRDEAVVVRETTVVPPPVERTELGELTWRLSLAPGESGEVALGFRVDLGKGIELTGWRE
ncbi:mucoidy inhibitor MuiA family protein [Micromonospora craniellae]|uniref:Mucoidy inhibitor MuiA family protein n=1 Tax=Micromonospora craniellae TaxID=2294034 RepID=A0A372FUG7_9ACTN|nr:mucoidy inhibitor MuiA family protein [Micromonospora craniellae]QOC92217.1 mucoidy inhibitor MuiA family protein [Micromonospora craniellae]RFS44348.1 mucoidy inhibitor MuiA family protein [Micromonospora craniellae]